jgi:opacity protein-like surface antigen
VKAPAASGWSGLYIGVNGGGGWSNTGFPRGFNADPTAFWPYFPDPGQRASGGLVGGQAGYNWQYGRAVGGLEVDFDTADIESTSNFSLPAPQSTSQQVKTDELASLRGRLGWTVLPDLLLYGTGGFALGHFQGALTSIAPNANANLGEVTFQATSGGATEVGWVAGAGLEYKLLDHWLVRGEYLHYGFGTVNNLIASVDATPAFDALNARTSVDVVRAGLSYKF